MTSNEDKIEKEKSMLIDQLSKKVLDDLKNGNSETHVEELMQAVEEYAALPNHNMDSIKQWQEDIAEITKLLEAEYLKIQEELKGLVENNPKISAYDKASEAAAEEEK